MVIRLRSLKLYLLIFLTCFQFLALGKEVFEVEIFIKNHKFESASGVDVSTEIVSHKVEPLRIEVPVGVKIRLIVHNKDKTIEEFESFDLKREKIILGNSKANIILAPLKAGEYKFFGEFHEETAQGIIIVK